MPTYTYKCTESGKKIERFNSIKEYQPVATCNCGSPAERYFDRAPAGFVKADLPVYRCPITDIPITSRREHEENLARHGCRILETGEKEQMLRAKAAEEAAFDAQIEATAEEFVEKLPSAKREQLGRELKSGLDITVARQ